MTKDDNSMKNPNQPLYEDSTGTLRFKENKVVNFLLESGPVDMNQLALCNFSEEDRAQFAQLIGYSYYGFSELAYVEDEKFEEVYEENSDLIERYGY